MTMVPSSPGSTPSSPVPAAGTARKGKKTAPPFLAMAVIGLCLIILVAVGIFVVYPQMNAAWEWRKAQQAIDLYRLQEAREHLKHCVKVWPDSGETYFLLARTCRRAGDLDEARQYLREAKRLNWVAQEIQLESYLIQAQTLLMPWVEEKLRGFLEEKHPEERLILEGLVMACLQSNLLKRALQWTTVWVEHHPEDWQAHYWNGSVFAAGLRYEWAIKEFEKAQEQKPHFPPIEFQLAQTLLLAGNHAEALPYFQEYLKSDPANPAALLGLARCQRAGALAQEAKDTLARLLAVRPEDEGGYFLAAQLALEEDDFSAAKDWLGKSLRLDPSDRLANELMGALLRREASALSEQGRQPEADEKRKEAELYQKKSQEITNAANRIRDIRLELLAGSDNVNLRTEAATALMQVGQYDEAFRWLISALLVDPNCQPAKEALGQCLKKLGNRKLEELYQPIIKGR